MVTQGFVALLIGIGVGLIYYMMSPGQPQRSSYQEGYSTRRHSSSVRQTNQQINHFDDECSICLSSISGHDKVQLSPCLHVFHKDCIRKWSTVGPPVVHTSCPNCRSKFMNSNF